MKRVKKLFILSGAVILCGVIVFSACKKDKDSEAVALAKRTCECSKTTQGEEQLMCLMELSIKLANHMNLETGKFKDKNFETDYVSYLQKNCPSAIEQLNPEEED